MTGPNGANTGFKLAVECNKNMSLFVRDLATLIDRGLLIDMVKKKKKFFNGKIFFYIGVSIYKRNVIGR